MRKTAVIVAVVLLAGATTLVGQRRGGFGAEGRRGWGRPSRTPIAANAPYDGRFTFVRVRYGPDYGFVSQGLPWSHDYPTGEQHFMKIVKEVSLLEPRTLETNVLPFDSPDLSTSTTPTSPSSGSGPIRASGRSTNRTRRTSSA